MTCIHHLPTYADSSCFMHVSLLPPALDGAEHILLEGARHVPLEERKGQLWYGSGDYLESWVQYLQDPNTPAIRQRAAAESTPGAAAVQDVQLQG